MKPNLICLVFAAAVTVSSGVAFGDSINSVSCSTPGAPLVTGTTSCSAAYYGYASAASTSTVILPSYMGQAAQIATDATAYALLGGSRGIAAFSTARTSTDVSINFDTAGPARNGFLELNFLQTSWTTPAFGSISELLIIGSYTVAPNGQNLSLFIPIQLGSNFSFTYLNSILSNGDAATGIDLASIGSDISLLAFEADQTTAVELFDPPSSVIATPEPGSFGLMAVATLMVAACVGASLSRRYRHQR